MLGNVPGMLAWCHVLVTHERYLVLGSLMPGGESPGWGGLTGPLGLWPESDRRSNTYLSL